MNELEVLGVGERWVAWATTSWPRCENATSLLAMRVQVHALLRVLIQLNCFLRIAVSISEQLLRRNVKRFRGGLEFKAHRLLYHSTLGVIEIKEKEETHLLPRCESALDEVVGFRGLGLRVEG